MGPSSRRLVVRRSDQRRRGRQRQRLGLQSRAAPGHRLRSRRQVSPLVGRGTHPPRARDRHRARWHRVAHRRSAPHDPPVHAGREAAAHPRRSRPALDAARRQAVQPADALGRVPEDRRRLHLRRLRQLARAQVRSQGAPPAVLGRAGHRPRLLQHPAQHRHRCRRSRLRRRSRELARADLRPRRAVPGPVEQPAPAVRARRRSPDRRVLRRRAADASARQREGAEHRRPGQHPVDQGRADRPGRRALRRRETGRVRGAARRGRRLARRLLRGRGGVDGAGQ